MKSDILSYVDRYTYATELFNLQMIMCHYENSLLTRPKTFDQAFMFICLLLALKQSA